MARKFVVILSLWAVITAPVAASEDSLMLASSSSTRADNNAVHSWVLAFEGAWKEQKTAPIKYFPGSSLGREDARTELMRLGLLHIGISGSQEISIYSRLQNGFKLPFLFDSYAHYDRFMFETEFIDLVNEELAPHDLVWLDVILLGGMTGIFNTVRPVEQVSDLEGLRLRAMDSHGLALINSWGLSGVQVAWEEVPQALGTGVAHGYINPPLVPIMFGHTNQIKYFSDVRIHPSARSVLVSRKWYLGLSEEKRAHLHASIEAARQVNRDWTRRVQKEERQILEENGVQFQTISREHRAEFRNRAISAIKEELPEDVYEEIMRMVELTRDERPEP